MSFVTPDHRRRITLPPAFKPGALLAMEEMDDGSLRVVPMTAIPTSQLWAWTPESLAQTAAALKNYHEGMVVDADSPEGKAFLADLAR
jgi:hypothetical protein